VAYVTKRQADTGPAVAGDSTVAGGGLCRGPGRHKYAELTKRRHRCSEAVEEGERRGPGRSEETDRGSNSVLDPGAPHTYTRVSISHTLSHLHAHGF